MRGRPALYPFATMAPGDTITFTTEGARARNAAYQYGIRKGWKFLGVFEKATGWLRLTRLS